jgi:16S rRNA processing protein RimM
VAGQSAGAAALRGRRPDRGGGAALVGLRVRDAAGAGIGTITEVLHLPGQDLLAVARPGDGELLVPFVRPIVPEVDVAGGFIVVDLPDGLSDLAAG